MPKRVKNWFNIKYLVCKFCDDRGHSDRRDDIHLQQIYDNRIEVKELKVSIFDIIKFNQQII
jgi:hypothetical protein